MITSIKNYFGRIFKSENSTNNQNENKDAEQKTTTSSEQQPNSTQQPTGGQPTQNVGPTSTTTVKSAPTKKQKRRKIILWTLIIVLIVTLVWSIFFSESIRLVSQYEMESIWNTRYDGSEATAGGSQIYIVDYGYYVQVEFYMYSGNRLTAIYGVIFDTIEQAEAWVHTLNGLTLNTAGNPINETFYQSAYNGAIAYTGPGWFATFVLTWLPWLLFFVLGLVLVRKIMEKQSGSGKIQKNLVPQISPVRFSDISGYLEVKDELTEIVDFLKQPAKYSSAGVRTPKGILLTGSPGTGKTLWAKAIAGEAGAPFYSISGSDFVELYVGVGASRVRALFENAKNNAPSIIFIDEIDAVGRQRGAGVGGGNDEREQTLNQLLVEMDGFAGNSGVIVIAATNRPDVLDPALKRPGRFDREIEIRLPDVIEREAILKNYAARGGKKFASDVEFSNIAWRTPGFSGAELENVINEAAILAIRSGARSISLEVLDEAIDRVMGGPSRPNSVISIEEKRHVAIHESGHAIIGLVKEHANKVQKISIVPRGQAGGYVLMTPKKDKMIQTKLELIATITSFMGGRAAEEVFFGKDNVSTGASDDIVQATSIARRMVTEWGMSSLGPIQLEERQGSVFLGKSLGSEKRFSSETGKEIDKEIRRIIESGLEDAEKIVREHKDLVHLFADALMIKETLNMEEIDYIFKHKVFPKSIDEIKLRKEKKESKKHKEEKKEDSKK